MEGSKSNMHQVKNTNRCKKKKTSTKVVYISSPLMVTTCASKFMSLVQELTGRHSDITHLLENSYGNHRVFDRPATSAGNSAHLATPAEYSADVQRESPTTSGSLLLPSDDAFMTDGFLDLLQSDLLFDASELDVLRGYDA